MWLQAEPISTWVLSQTFPFGIWTSVVSTPKLLVYVYNCFKSDVTVPLLTISKKSDGSIKIAIKSQTTWIKSEKYLGQIGPDLNKIETFLNQILSYFKQIWYYLNKIGSYFNQIGPYFNQIASNLNQIDPYFA